MRRWMPRNLGSKFGALALAVLLWIAIFGEPDLVTTHTAPVLYQNLRSGLLVTGNAPESVHIELRGPTRRLTVASLSDTVALLDLADVNGPGERTFTISAANLDLPRGVTFLRAVPSQFRLDFARLLTRDVPVRIRFSGELPKGLRLAEQRVFPEKLKIAGSENRVLSVQDVETDSVDLKSVKESGDFLVNAFVADPQVRFESSPMVTVSLTIEKTAAQN